jgi:hypothetical protein
MTLLSRRAVPHGVSYRSWDQNLEILDRNLVSYLPSDETRIFRKICGPIRENRWNSKIHSLYKDLNIVGDIKIRRPGEAGHILRREHETILEKNSS